MNTTKTKSKLRRDKQQSRRKPGSQFFINKIDGMSNPSIGYCSHYPPYEVFVVDVVKSETQEEKIKVEVIGIIGL